MELMHGSGKSFLADDDKLVSELKVVSWLGMPNLDADFGLGPPNFMIRAFTPENTAYIKMIVPEYRSRSRWSKKPC